MALQCGNQTNKAAFPSRDAKLVALAKAGDENAYAELIKGALPTARRAVRSILRAEVDAEDALQETFLAAIKGGGKPIKINFTSTVVPASVLKAKARDA